MAKRGGSVHTKRIAVPKTIPVHDKKHRPWFPATRPGPHPKGNSIPLSVLLRDVLGFVETAKEAKIVLNEGKVLVDGKIRKDPRFPVGLMDIISIPSMDKYYMIVVHRGRLVPKEIDKKDTSEKLLKITSKTTVKAGKIALGFHDGRTYLGDNNMRVGDTVHFDLKNKKVLKIERLSKNVTCLITDGKHAGKEGVLMELFEPAPGRPAEALIHTPEGDVRTLAKYLFVLGGGSNE